MYRNVRFSCSFRELQAYWKGFKSVHCNVLFEARKMSVTKPKNIISFVAWSVGSAFVVMFLHELGHAIAAALCGAAIDELTFNHATWGNAPFTASQLAWVYINGTLFPVLISLFFFWFPRGDNRQAGAVAFGAVIGGWIELDAWTVMSFLLYAESDPYWFLTFSGADAVTVRIISVAVCILFTAAVCWRCSMLIVRRFFGENRR